MPKNLDGWLKRIRRIMYVLLIFSVLILIWIVSFHLSAIGYAALPPIKTQYDLAAILFSSAQVSLFVISIIIGLLAIFGFQYFESKIREAVERETDKRLTSVEREARGRSFAIQGYLIGENSVTADFTAPTHKERLREAIRYCDEAYTNYLKGTGLPAEFLALNNFLGYSCALHDTSRRGYLLECAQQLRKAAEEHDSPNLLLTYSRTILVFSLDPTEISEACSMVEDIKSNPRLDDKQKREAEYLASLCQQRRISGVT